MDLKSNLFRFVKYIEYWLECVDEHSLHSPFTFGFYNEIIKDKKKLLSQFDGIEKLRKILLKDSREIEIQDLGAGSSINLSSKRTIKDIAKHSLTPQKSSLLYFNIIKYFEARTVLELGTSLGINSLYMASNSSVEKVITIEGCAQTADVARKNFEGLIHDKIELIHADIESSFSDVAYHVNQLDFILMDANHTYEATMRYFDRCKQFIHEGTVLVIDDIYWSKGMSQAWDEIKLDVSVTLSFDLFEMGIVFFKKNLHKEHYVLSK